MANATSSAAGKAVAVWFPISAFVALGLEHSVRIAVFTCPGQPSCVRSSPVHRLKRPQHWRGKAGIDNPHKKLAPPARGLPYSLTIRVEASCTGARRPAIAGLEKGLQHVAQVCEHGSDEGLGRG